MHRKVSGFTIVELVVVIILLGILAATALPRFINIDDEAHSAVRSATQGGLQTGVSMFHAQWVAQTQPAPGVQFPDFDNLRTNASGFPYSLTANAGNDVSDENDCIDVFQNVMQSGAPSIVGAAALGGVAAVGANAEFVAVPSATPGCSYVHTAQDTWTSGDTIAALLYDSADGSVVEGTVALP